MRLHTFRIAVNFCLIVVISVIPNVNTVDIKASMHIHDGLNLICDNDENASDTLPSCECLEKFTVQKSIFLGMRRNNKDPESGSGFRSLNYTATNYLSKIWINSPSSLIVYGLIKTSGQKCLDDMGEESDLGTTYLYSILYYATVSGLTGASKGEYSVLTKSSQFTGVTYLHGMTNKENAWLVDYATISIDGKLAFQLYDLGDACESFFPPNSFETSLWNLIQTYALNSAFTCNIPANTTVSMTSFKYTLGAITTDKPLSCGSYEATVFFFSPSKKVMAGMPIIFYWNLPHDVYCAPLQ